MPLPLNAQYHPVIQLPSRYEVFDFTRGYDPERTLRSPFGVGRYGEDRKGMYNTELFQGAEGNRTVHLGIDIAAPVSTPVFAFHEGDIHSFGCNPAPGDYGFTLITRHRIDGAPVFALFGHLSAESIRGKRPGQKILRGEAIASIGDRQENGGWNPHLHFQLSRIEPSACDMPGVCTPADFPRMREIFPDPRMVLGPLY